MATISLKETFRLARKKMGLSQNQLALKLGVSNTTIRNYEKGRRGSKADPATLWNFSNIVPPDFRDALREFVPENFRRAVETAGAEIDTVTRSRRYSDETISQLHQALDIVLDRAPSATVENVTAILERMGGMWGEHPERMRKPQGEPRIIPTELDTEITRVARERGLDTSAILRDALSLGLDALSRGAAAQRQVKINKEAHRRAHSRS